LERLGDFKRPGDLERPRDLERQGAFGLGLGTAGKLGTAGGLGSAGGLQVGTAVGDFKLPTYPHVCLNSNTSPLPVELVVSYILLTTTQAKPLQGL
jgi:hypothetical protein